MRNATLEKGLLLLEAMASEARDFSLAELAGLSGLEKSHACRLVKSLVARGYAIQDQKSRAYRIGLRTLELSSSILARMELHRVGITYLRDLSDRVDASTYLGVLHLGQVLTVATMYPGGVYKDGAPGFGSVMELDDSAMGKVLVTFSDAMRGDGLVPEQELAAIREGGVGRVMKPKGSAPKEVGVAAAVRNCEGHVVAALGASLSKVDWDQRDQDEFSTEVRRAAGGLSFALGHAASRVVA